MTRLAPHGCGAPIVWTALHIERMPVLIVALARMIDGRVTVETARMRQHRRELDKRLLRQGKRTWRADLAGCTFLRHQATCQYQDGGQGFDRGAMSLRAHDSTPPDFAGFDQESKAGLPWTTNVSSIAQQLSRK
jgi:hypothetical protein